MRSRALAAALLLLTLPAAGEVKRLVILKVDGLPERVLEQYTQPGHVRLPWIQSVFAERGVWFDHFYTRGLSLSAPSWSLLDTGRHLEIRGNAEYDRYTLRSWDYLNFFPFYVGYAMSRRVDMPGVELLDQQGVPLLIDRFPYEQRYQGFQLLQRGVRWSTLEGSLKSKFTSRPLRELFDEWQTGFSMTSGVTQSIERELLQSLADPNIRYLDYFTGDFDHVSHLTADRIAQFETVAALDGLVGRVWRAVQSTPLAATTAIVLVSDHGMNTADGVYSQGFNLVEWFNSPQGGAHHVLTNRHPLTEFKLRGLDPFVSAVVTPSQSSEYLAGESTYYPTAVLDLDGNERANIGLRNSALNTLHILLDQIVRKKLPGPLRIAAIDTFYRLLDQKRPEWQRDLAAFRQELAGLHEQLAQQQTLVDGTSKKWTKDQRALGFDKEARRHANRLETMKNDEKAYENYVSTMTRLLTLGPADFDPAKFKIDDVIPRRSLGTANTIRELQHYVTGPSAEGFVVSPFGGLDIERSFRTTDYFRALSAISVRNNVQKDVAPRPIDFIAIRVPAWQLAPVLTPSEATVEDCIWLWKSAEKQALLLTRHDDRGRLELKYVPVARLTEDEFGILQFEREQWADGFPLEVFEDPQFGVPEAGRAAWLGDWHDERTWLDAVHKTRYSNGVIGLTEQLLSAPSTPSSSATLDAYRARRQQLRRTDMLVFANDHWNFNVRGFNPGGNHGSFLRASTHSVLLISGGKDTGIPEGLHVKTPYDSLSFVPSLLDLLGMPEKSLPGPLIHELRTK